MQPTCELLATWAGQPSGFIWIDGKGWRNVQETAANYLADIRRQDAPSEWEASAQRFIDAVIASDRWCLDPAEAEMLDEAIVLSMPMPLPWKGNTQRRRTG